MPLAVITGTSVLQRIVVVLFAPRLHPEPAAAAPEPLDDADETVDWPLSPLDLGAGR